MINEVEECWSCKGQGFVVKKEGVKPSLIYTSLKVNLRLQLEQTHLKLF